MSWFDEIGQILNELHHGILAIDSEERIIVFNRQAERLLGISALEAVGCPIRQVIPASELPNVLVSGKPETGQKVKLAEHLTIITNRTPVIKDGKIVGAMAVFQDVSELESLASELKQVRELNKELQAILESSYDGIGVIAGDGTLLKVNNSYGRITGLTDRDNGVGRNVRQLQDDGTVSQAVALLVLNQKKAVTIKQKIKTGKEILITGSPVFNENGEIFRVVCNIRDMTELNTLKEQMESTQQQNQIYANEIQKLRTRLLQHEEFIFRSAAMEKIFNVIVRVAGVDSHVLLTGDSGVGKEVASNLIHKLSPRANAPFLQINCGAIPESLLESEFFGYEEGAFTGARSGGKKGIFELCQGGTLLLDEIAEMPLNLQVKLLRVLQKQEIFTVGSTKPIKFDVRIIAATNRNLEEMVAQQSFRADLFYRLNVIPIHIPALREHPEDIVPLAINFLEKFNRKHKSNKRFEPEVLSAFERYPWYGNVRELENLVERLVIVNDDEVLTLRHLPGSLSDSAEVPLVVQVNKPVSFKEAVELLEKELLRKTMQDNPSTRQAARVLGVSHPTVIRKLNHYKLQSR
ncbi:MAG TPA: sigma 54-interacting transcriptional regulator [Verrucomicrobiae bacterium]|nr:sigma 54-interacting transcriptional regulator [Verrucomicrobiae bacterium]